MTTRMMRRGVVPVACLLFLVLGTGHGYPQVVIDESRPKLSDPPPIRVAAPPSQPASKTVDELINRLEELRKQKAELEKQEKAVVEQLRERLKSQSDRLAKLGIVPLAPEPREVPKDADDTLPFLKK
jgi:hypothetical protein